MATYITHKYIIWTLLSSINTLLITLYILYEKYWYIFLILLALQSTINCLSIISIFIKNLFYINNNEQSDSNFDVKTSAQQLFKLYKFYPKVLSKEYVIKSEINPSFKFIIINNDPSGYISIVSIDSIFALSPCLSENIIFS